MNLQVRVRPLRGFFPVFWLGPLSFHLFYYPFATSSLNVSTLNCNGVCKIQHVLAHSKETLYYNVVAVASMYTQNREWFRAEMEKIFSITLAWHGREWNMYAEKYEWNVKWEMQNVHFLWNFILTLILIWDLRERCEKIHCRMCPRREERIPRKSSWDLPI